MIEASAIVAIIAVSLTGISSITHVVLTNMIKSRCLKLSCCGCYCERDVLDKEELEIVNQNENKK